MRRGVKRPQDSVDDSDLESITSKTVQLPLPENLDADNEANPDDCDLFGRDSPAQWDEYSVPTPDERAGPDDPSSFLNETDKRNLKSMIDNACLSA